MTHATVMVAVAPAGDVETLVKHEMEPFDEHGECFADGSRWDWWVIGGRYSGRFLGEDVMTAAQYRAAVADGSFRAQQQERARKWWADSKEVSSSTRRAMWSVEEDDTEDSYVERYSPGFITAHAFLRARTWHEGERMGWFAGTAKSECELKGEDSHHCLHRNEEMGAKIVVWNEGKDVWEKNFVRRFIQPLADDVRLVMVDYHV